MFLFNAHIYKDKNLHDCMDNYIHVLFKVDIQIFNLGGKIYE